MIKILLLITFSILLSADIGMVTIVKGEASLNRNIEVLEIRNNMELFKQDIVETQEGRLQMLFKDNTVISLGKDSRFLIKEYLNAQEPDRAIASFVIEKGFVQTITGSIGKTSTQLFTLETATTKITPIGTIWSVEVNEDSEKYRVIEGKINLAFNDGLQRVIELQTGETMVLERGEENKIKSFHKIRIKNIQEKQDNNYNEKIEKFTGVLKEEIEINEGTPVNDDGSIYEDIVKY